MRIFLGGQLVFYHPNKDKWLDVKIDQATSLIDILNKSNIPLAEVHLVVINGAIEDLKSSMVSETDEVRLYSAVGGG